VATLNRQPDEWDVPLGGLSNQLRQVFERNHIEVAVAEIRFIRAREEIAESDAAAIWERVGPQLFPILEPHKQQTVNVAISPEGAQQSAEVQEGWLLATGDRRTAITLLPSSVIVQTQAYEHYSQSIGEFVNTVLPAFAEVTRAVRVQRLGMRYINRLTDADATHPNFWGDRIEPSFAAPLRGPFAEIVVGQHQQVQLRLADADARIQSGLLPVSGRTSRFDYLVDLDVFIEKTRNYEATRCANQMRQLNRTAFALFSNVLSNDYLQTFGPTEPQEEPATATIETPTGEERATS
jgi:uncharacterized protein (TIGR04255 family)